MKKTIPQLFEQQDLSPLSKYAGSEITFENPQTKEKFEGTVEEHRNTKELYVRVPELRGTVQRVQVKDVLSIQTYFINGEQSAI